MQSWLTHCSQPQVEASVVDPWTRDGRRGVDRIVVTIFSGSGIPELPDLPVHRQLSLGPEKVDVDEEEEEEAAEEQIDVEQLKKSKTLCCLICSKRIKIVCLKLHSMYIFTKEMEVVVAQVVE